MADIHHFVARAVAVDLEGGDVVAQRDLDSRLGAENQVAHMRVQAVSANDQIDFARGAMVEPNSNAIARVFDMRDRIAENGLDLPIEGVINRRRKIGPAQAGETAVGHATENIDGETAALRPCASTKRTSCTW